MDDTQPKPTARGRTDGKPSDFGELPSGLSLRVEDSRVAWETERRVRFCRIFAHTD
jgi:hypothetical protein